MTPNDRWSLDFVSDQLTCGRRFRILTVVDDCTRECLALVADTSLSGIRVARELDRLMVERGLWSATTAANSLAMPSLYGALLVKRKVATRSSIRLLDLALG
jgi:transposase InsO family protein